MIITEGTLETIAARASAAAPHEVCGFFTTEGINLHIDNISVAPERFVMDPVQQKAFQELLEEEIMGVWHSHPNGNPEPSALDIVNVPDNMRYFILTPRELVEWKIEDGNATAVTRMVVALPSRAG